MDINKFLRELIGNINWAMYDFIVKLSNYFPWLKR